MRPALLLLLLCAGRTRAEDKLLPTDLLLPGQVLLNLDYVYTRVDEKLSSPILTRPADVTERGHQGLVTLGIGLLERVEAQVQLPYVFNDRVLVRGDTAAGGLALDSLSRGQGDVSTQVRFALTDPQPDRSPKAVLGLLGVFPSGRRKTGRPEIDLAGARLQDRDMGAPGDGVVSYGASLSVSKAFEGAKPYAVGSFLRGGRARHNGVDEYYADQGTVQAGLQLQASERVTLDLSGLGFYSGPEVHEDSGARVRVERALGAGAAVAVIVEVAPRIFLTLGTRYATFRPQIVDLDAGSRVSGLRAFYPNAGLHVLLGGPGSERPLWSRY